MHENDLKNTNILKTIIRDGDVCVDVGAHIGDYTNFFLECLGNTGRIYSIELNPEICDVLFKRFYKDRNVVVMNYAVSNTNAASDYFKGDNSYTYNIIGHNLSLEPNENLGKIATRRLDTILDMEDSIRVIKIDVEGAELLVLEGLWNIVDRVDYLLVECHQNEDWPAIAKLLEHYKYDCINVEDNTVANIDSNRAYQCFCTKRK